MKTTSRVAEFFGETDIRLILDGDQMPAWLSAAVRRAGQETLTIDRCGSQVSCAEGYQGISCVLHQTGQETSLGIVYHESSIAAGNLKSGMPHGPAGGSSDKGPWQLLEAAGLTLPGCLDFLRGELEKLDVSYLVLYREWDAQYSETIFVVWNQRVCIIPSLLELDGVVLQMNKSGNFYGNVVSGRFRVGTVELLLSFQMDLGEELAMRVSAADGKFPGLQAFVTWLSGESAACRRLFSWMGVGEADLDVAISGAELTVNTRTGELTDAGIDVKLTLFHIPFDVTFHWRSRTLQAGLSPDTRLSVKELMEHMGLHGTFPPWLQEIVDLEISWCRLMVQMESGSCLLECRIEGNIHLGALYLKAVTLCISRTGAGVSFLVSSTLDLETELDLREIPLLTEVLPPSFTCSMGPVTVGYDHGRIRDITAQLAFQTVGSASARADRPHPAEGPREPPHLAEGPGEPLHPAEEAGEPPRIAAGGVCESNGTSWTPLRRDFGPVHIDQVGVTFENGVLMAAVTGEMKAGMIAFRLKGLTVGYDLERRAVTGGLQGMGIHLHTDGFSVEGSMYRRQGAENTPAEYEGTVLVKVSRWQFAGMASYTKTENGDTSLFVYVCCGLPLGGVPAFQITGVVGGFGLNRKLQMPEIKELQGFPLLEGPRPMDTLLAELTGSGPAGGGTWLEVSRGDYWLAAGVEFCSFGLAQGKVLLACLFGEELRLGLLGSAELTLPKGASREHAYAYLKLFLSAVFRPKEGSLMILAALSGDSFVFSRACHVSGEAAFALWFGKHPHAGDFVLTIGGYHPSFSKPGHYPAADRIAFQWQISSTVSAKGSAYLAVTPSCIMAGGSLEFLFQAGALKAWFDAYLDLVMGWHPFYFEAELKVEMGVSLRLNLLFCHKTLTLSAGADLRLWGPGVGGRARVHLSVISFTVAFGDEPAASGKTVEWQQFSELLSEEVHHVTAEQGIHEDENGTWISRNGQFCINVETEIPAGNLGIRPMGLSDVQSEWKVQVSGPGGASWVQRGDSLEGVAQARVQNPIQAHTQNQVQAGNPIQANTQNQSQAQARTQARLETPPPKLDVLTGDFPEALWGEPQEQPTADAGILRGLASGCRWNTCGLVRVVGSNHDYTKEELVRVCRQPLPLSGDTENPAFVPLSDSGAVSVLQHMADEAQQKKRAQLCEAVGDFYTGPSGSFSRLASAFDSQWTDVPMLVV